MGEQQKVRRFEETQSLLIMHKHIRNKDPLAKTKVIRKHLVIFNWAIFMAWCSADHHEKGIGIIEQSLDGKIEVFMVPDRTERHENLLATGNIPRLADAFYILWNRSVFFGTDRHLHHAHKLRHDDWVGDMLVRNSDAEWLKGQTARKT